ncbi:MAG: nucleotidyltransferase family protein [Elusimicrobia bacterium]|nr:nucleotidyltransferase family protein [Elusimicrobiota bacterium]
MKNDVLSRNILLMDAARVLAEECFNRGIPVVFLKGAALLELGIFKFPEREMTDIDVLIRKHERHAVEKTVLSMGFREMENSSSAFVKTENPFSPPVIIDVHADLRHLKNTDDFFKEAFSPDNALSHILVPSTEDLFLHLACHPLLHHGHLGDKAVRDAKKVLEWVSVNPVRNPPCPLGTATAASGRLISNGVKGNLKFFMEQLVSKAEKHRLKPVVYPILQELSLDVPELKPGGFEAAKERFFRNALHKHSAFMEYLLPVILRPALALKYLFPEKEFLRKRYGRQSAWNVLIRPFQLLKNIFIRNL